MDIVEYVLDPSIFQELTTTRNVMVAAVRPHLVLVNSPSGTIKVRITDISGAHTVAESDEIDIADMHTVGNNFHGLIEFDVEAFLRKNTTYRFYVIAGGGYSYTVNSYAAVSNDYNLQIYDRAYTPSTILQYPVRMEIWERSQK